MSRMPASVLKTESRYCSLWRPSTGTTNSCVLGMSFNMKYHGEHLTRYLGYVVPPENQGRARGYRSAAVHAEPSKFERHELFLRAVRGGVDADDLLNDDGSIIPFASIARMVLAQQRKVRFGAVVFAAEYDVMQPEAGLKARDELRLSDMLATPGRKPGREWRREKEEKATLVKAHSRVQDENLVQGVRQGPYPSGPYVSAGVASEWSAQLVGESAHQPCTPALPIGPVGKKRSRDAAHALA